MKFLLDLVFPKKCAGCGKLGAYFCDICFSKIEFNSSFVCPMCERLSINGMTHPKCQRRFGIDGIVPILSYNTIIKKALYQFKYEPYISDMKGALAQLMYEGVIQNESCNAFLQRDCLLVAVPLSKERFRKRGFNQSELLAEELSKKLQLPILRNYLARSKSTKPQYKLPKKDRFNNVRGAFELRSKKKKDITDKTLILIDDVSTTGATLRMCAGTLKRNGAARVFGITLAKERYE